MANKNNDIIKADGIELFGRTEDEPKQEEFGLDGGLHPEIDFVRIRNVNDYITFEKSAWVPSTDAATAGLYPIFYIANLPCFLIEARERHGAAGGSSATVTVEKLPNGTAKGSTTGSMLNAAFDLTLVANTIQRQNVTIVLAGGQLAPGDAVALRSSGTLTGAQDVIVTVLFGVELKNIPAGQSVTTLIVGI